MSDPSADYGHIRLASFQQEAQTINVCEHIAINAYPSQNGGEYEKDLLIFCSICGKAYYFIVDVGC